MEIEWEKAYGSETSDTEAHSGMLADDALLTCGCSGGKATPTGGLGWKAHIMKLSLSGDLIWERAIRIRGNECAYNVLYGSKLFLFGETDNGFFLSCLDAQGNPEWTKDFGRYDGVMAGGIVATDNGFILSGSVKTDDGWNARLFKIDPEGKIDWERDVTCERVFQMRSDEGGIIMVGECSGKIFLARTDMMGTMLWEREYGAGIGVSVFADRGEYLLGGDNGNGRPIVCRIGNDGTLLRRIEIEGNGWIEAVAKYNGRTILARHVAEPLERTEIILMEL
ncbi:MAG: hypothetical protein R6W91_02245 [Thermoplasmata archaeon]